MIHYSAEKSILDEDLEKVCSVSLLSYFNLSPTNQESGDWDWHVYTDVYKIDDWLKKNHLCDKKKELDGYCFL